MLQLSRIGCVLGLLLALTLSTGAAGQTSPPPPAGSPADLVKQGRALGDAGKQDEALALYRRALEIEPTHADAHLAAGIALDLKGDYERARVHLGRAIELAAPDRKTQALATMAISYAFEGKADSAARYYRQAFDAQTTAKSFTAAAGTANALGRIYVEAGDTANALQWYQTGWESAKQQADLPPNERALWEMRWHHAQARIAVRRGRTADANEHVAAFKALMDRRANPDDSNDHQYLLGYLALYSGNHDVAIAALSKGNLKDPFILSLLAQAHEKKGESANAREYYRSVLENHSHSINTAHARPLARRKLGH